MTTNVTPVITVWFDLSATGGDFFKIEDPVKGALDTGSPLAGEIATDIAGYGFDFRISRGRSRALDEIEAGTCSVMVRNFTGDFMPPPFNTATGMFGDDAILPGKRVAISVEGVTIFDGRIEDWNFDHPTQYEATASFVAVDQLGMLGRLEFDDWTTTALQTAGQRLDSILDRPEVNFGPNRDLDAGNAPLQADVVSWGSNVLNYCQLVSASEMGRFFASRDGLVTFRDLSYAPTPTLTFSDDGDDIPYTAIQLDHGSELLFNRVSVDREGGTQQTATNTTSIEDYGPRSLSKTGLVLNTDDQCLDLAEYLCSIYSIPRARISSLTVVLDALTELQRAEVLSLDITDAVTVEWTPQGLVDQSSSVMIIEGVSHQHTVTGLHTVSFSFSPFEQIASFIIGDATYGRLDTGGGLSF